MRYIDYQISLKIRIATLWLVFGDCTLGVIVRITTLRMLFWQYL